MIGFHATRMYAYMIVCIYVYTYACAYLLVCSQHYLDCNYVDTKHCGYIILICAELKPFCCSIQQYPAHDCISYALRWGMNHHKDHTPQNTMSITELYCLWNLHEYNDSLHIVKLGQAVIRHYHRPSKYGLTLHNFG